MADVKYTVTVDSTGAVKQIEQLDAAWNKTSSSMKGTTETAGTTEKAHKSLWAQIGLGQIAANYAMQGLRMLKNEFLDSIKQAADYEKAHKGLAAAFEISGRTMPGMVDSLTKYAGKLEDLGLAEDDEVLRSESLTMQMTNLNEEGIKATTRGAIGLAAVFGMDLSAATEAVARGMEGQYRALNIMFPALRNATGESEKHATLLKIMEGLYQRAIADTETYAGQVKKMNLEWKNAKQTFGEAILSTGILQEAMSELTRQINYLTGAHQKLAMEEMDAFVEAEKEASEILWKVGEQTGKNSSWAYDLGQQYHLTAQQVLEWVRSNMLGTKEAQAAEAAVKEHNAAVDAAGKGFSETGSEITKYQRNLKELGIAESETTIEQLKMAEETLAMAKASKASIGTIEDLQKKVKELQTKLEGTTLAYDKFGRLVSAESLKQPTAFREITNDMGGMDKAFDKSSSVLSQLIGGELGRLASAYTSVEDITFDLVRGTNKLTYSYEGLTKLKVHIQIKEMEKELERMKRTGGYTTDQIDDLERSIRRLKATTKETPKAILDLRRAMEEVAPYMNAAVQGMQTIFAQAQKNKEIAIENEYKKRLDLINKTVTNEEEKQKAIMALEAEFEIKRTSARAAGAKQQKAIALAEAIWNTARAVSEALPNIVLAAIVGAMGAIQIGLIAKQPIPLARGAVFTRPTILSTSEGQTLEVGEEGIEYLVPEKHLASMRGGPPGMTAPSGRSTRVTHVHINSPLVSTSGLTDADLQLASRKLYRAMMKEERRRGRS